MVFSISWSREEVESGGSTFLNDNLMKHNPPPPFPPHRREGGNMKHIQMALGEITCNEVSVQQATPPPLLVHYARLPLVFI